jgi:uncharacterized cupredoxin-like copper-binding protein
MDMSIQEGTHKIGPENGTVTIKTGREGAAAKAGHDLTLEATSWEGTLELGDNPSVKITIDPASIEVRKGEGGAKALDDGDKADIKKSMKKDILGSDQISFESSDVKVDNGSMNVSGNGAVLGQAEPEPVRDQAVQGTDGRAEGQGHRRGADRGEAADRLSRCCERRRIAA